MTAWRFDQEVRQLQRLEKMLKVHPWRVCQRFVLTGPSDYGSPTLLVYNTHQPASTKRPFHQTQRINFCKAVLQDAMEHHASEPTCIGFLQAGDANCSMANWTAALMDRPRAALKPQFPNVHHALARGQRSDCHCW